MVSIKKFPINESFNPFSNVELRNSDNGTVAFNFSINGITHFVILTFEKQDFDEFLVDSITIDGSTYDLDMETILVVFGDYLEYNDTVFTDNSILKFLIKSESILTDILSSPTAYGAKR